MEKLIMIGAGGYAKSVLDSVDYFNYSMIGFVDQFSEKKEHLGYPILARELEEISNLNEYYYFISIGDNKCRKEWYDKIISLGLKTMNVVDKSAIVSNKATIGTGCFIGKMAIVNSEAIVKDNCIINTKALVEHGCTVESHANLSTNCVINGDVRIGEGTFMGSCSVTTGQLTIGSWSVVGAGAVVIDNLPDNIVAVGVPARTIRGNVKFI